MGVGSQGARITLAGAADQNLDLDGFEGLAGLELELRSAGGMEGLMDVWDGATQCVRRAQAGGGRGAGMEGRRRTAGQVGAGEPHHTWYWYSPSTTVLVLGFGPTEYHGTHADPTPSTSMYLGF